MLDAFTRATKLLGLDFFFPSRLGFLGSVVDFLSLSPRLLARLCRFASAQALYSSAMLRSRVGFSHHGTGVVDVDLLPSRAGAQPWKVFGSYDEAIEPSVVAGATPTADRLYKAGMLESPKCRWCGADKETIQHLTTDCAGMFQVLGNPGDVFPNQPNFRSHGILEASQSLLDSCKREQYIADLPSVMIQLEPNWLWGGASTRNGDHLLSKTAGFSIINASGGPILQQSFPDLFGCAYKGELMVLQFSLRLLRAQIHFVTRCLAIYDRWMDILRLGYVPQRWAFAHIWKDFFQHAMSEDEPRVVVYWNVIPKRRRPSQWDSWISPALVANELKLLSGAQKKYAASSAQLSTLGVLMFISDELGFAD
eukprot:Skav236783  [mRNA]  locus=scaffold1361:206693:207790:- [translate_table: standard]